MLPERLAEQLAGLAALAEQPPNRWEGFDLSRPDERATSLREQIGFAALALGALAAHPDAEAEERARGRAAVASLALRLAQRRVWAAWASEVSRAGRLPDPIDEGNAIFAGHLASLLNLADLLGGDPRLAEPLDLRWSNDFCFSYDGDDAAEALWRQARAHPDGAVASAGDTAHPHAMAHVLWALRLHQLARGGDYTAAGEPWLRALRERLALRGPRLPGRGALAGSYNTRRRSASLGGDSLSDAWTLALLAPLAPALAAELAPRYWAGARTLAERGDTLELAFAQLLAVGLGDGARAAELRAAVGGRRERGENITPWIAALLAIGEAGGLAHLLKAAGDSGQEEERGRQGTEGAQG